MAGYIGTKAALLSTTTASVGGDSTVGGDLTVDTDTLYVDSTNNRVGIGTSSPSADLEIASNNANIQLTDTDDSGYSQIRHNAGSLIFEADKGDTTALSAMRFDVDSSEAMRIDASGNLLVGTTDAAVGSNSTDVYGINLFNTGLIANSVDDGTSLILNRQNGDGPIAVFRKNGSSVAVIGINVSTPYLVRSGLSGVGIAGGGQFIATNSSGAGDDNRRDLGAASIRWDDVFATNGNIQTSDRNEKQDIAALTATEMLVAARISAMFKTFRWIDRVADNPNARTHTGIIAQDVQQAFTDEGLDAGDYSLFISTTWWETQTDVPAVAAVAEVLDDDGNVVTEAVEAQDAYTRTDTYDTQEDAPAGATERTRLGIRYPELLSFIAAYNEQRFASIEARLTALEAV